jgi:hypothetical protein
LSSGDVASGDFLMLAYDGTDLVWVNQGSNNNFATTTEQLTGTNATKASSPDSVAALWEAGADITDGAAITIGEGGYFNLITSTTAITSFSITTDKAGRTFRVRFDTVRTLTYNATSLIIPGAQSITTAVGDIAFIRSLGGGNVIVEAYTPSAGYRPIQLGLLVTTSGTTHSITGISPLFREIYIDLNGVSFSAAAVLTLAVSDDNGSNYGTARDIAVTTGSAGGAVSGTIRITNIQSGDAFPVAHSITAIAPTATATNLAVMLAEAGGAGSAINAIRFAGGTFDAGAIRVWGVL